MTWTYMERHNILGMYSSRRWLQVLAAFSVKHVLGEVWYKMYVRGSDEKALHLSDQKRRELDAII